MATPKKTKTAVQTEQQDNATKARVEGLTPEKALQSVGAAQAAIGRTLSNVGEQLQKSLQTLEDVNRTVELKQAELEELHGKDTLLRSTEELQVSYDQKKAELETDHQFQVKQLEDQRAQIERDNAEEDAEQELERTKKKLEEDAKLEQELHTARTEQRNKKEQLEKDWASREEILKKNENDFASYKQQVETFPATLKAAEEKAAGIAGNAVKREWEHKLALVEKDSANAKQMSELQTKTLQDQVTRLSLQLTEAYAKLDVANTKVAEIAKDAVNSASGQRALAEIQTFATAKENGAPPRKA